LLFDVVAGNAIGVVGRIVGVVSFLVVCDGWSGRVGTVVAVRGGVGVGLLVGHIWGVSVVVVGVGWSVGD